MREIKLFKIELPNKSSVYIEQRNYRVWLGNETKRTFPSVKEAKHFLAETNRFLSEKLFELNFMYTIAFSEYRKVWFYLSDNYDTKRIEDKVNECFAFADKMFTNAGTRSATLNGNYFVFNYLYAICEQLTIVFDKIIEVHKNRNYFADIKTVTSFKTRIETISKEIQSFGKC
jgi:hypothetical protein